MDVVLNYNLLIKIKKDIYPIDKEVWKKYTYHYDPDEQTITREVVGSYRQYPLRLAYAITIHKSQGQTFDSVIIDYLMQAMLQLSRPRGSRPPPQT